MKIKILLLILTACFASTAMAKKYWIDLGTDWYIYFDNGQTYIKSSQLPSGSGTHRHSCSHGRAQMSKTYGYTDYRKNMYAYILSGSVTGKPLSIVLDDVESTCGFFGARLH